MKLFLNIFFIITWLWIVYFMTKDLYEFIKKVLMRKNARPEKILIENFTKLLKGSVEIDKVENTEMQGFSDLVYSCQSKEIINETHSSFITHKGRSGFIEAKRKLYWPKRKYTKVKIDHYTAKQKLFLYRHGKAANGSAFLLIQVASTVMIFNWLSAQEVGTLTKVEMLEMCLYHYEATGNYLKDPIIKNMLIDILLNY